MLIFSTGPPQWLSKIMVVLSWPIIIAGKRLSSYPFFNVIIKPFFKRPHNEVISIPIQVAVAAPGQTHIPRRILERLLHMVDNIFVFDECMCRSLMDCKNHPPSIGCMALGPTVSQMHGSHGKSVDTLTAISHLNRAADAGLVATVAHTWIDTVAFGLTPFKSLMFICFCDDCCCIFRKHMKKRGAGLEGAYQRLPGLEISCDWEKCIGCGTCADACFLAAVSMEKGKARITGECSGCGRCIEVCEEGALSLKIEDEDSLLNDLVERIRSVSDLPLNTTKQKF